MKKYIKPQIELFEFEAEDMLAASQFDTTVKNDHTDDNWTNGDIGVLSNKKSGWTSDNWETAW